MQSCDWCGSKRHLWISGWGGSAGGHAIGTALVEDNVRVRHMRLGGSVGGHAIETMCQTRRSGVTRGAIHC